MSENKTPAPNSQPLKVEDILAKAEEIRNARDRQSSVTNSDLGEAFKLFTVVDEESKLLTKKKESFKIARLFWNWTGFGEKKLWDIIQILFVPVALAVAGFWFQGFTKDQEVKLADSKTKQELKVADDKAKQETLTKYLDQMSDLLEKGLLKSKQDSPMFIIAQSKTVTALQSLDAERQRLLIQFFESANLNTLDRGKGLLFEARMSKAQLKGIDLRHITLNEVDLSEANLTEARLMQTNLIGANLYSSKLIEAILMGSDLRRANLSSANLYGALFNSVDLIRSNLSKTNLTETDFAYSNLTNTNLEKAYIAGANFTKTNLQKANFSEAIILRTNLSAAVNLEKNQLENTNPPFICRVALPKSININANRDCAILPKILLERYPKIYSNLKKAEDSINEKDVVSEDNKDRTLPY
jgi:uncharacterized protein YjbI with pentapeptide repeats